MNSFEAVHGSSRSSQKEDIENAFSVAACVARHSASNGSCGVHVGIASRALIRSSFRPLNDLKKDSKQVALVQKRSRVRWVRRGV